MSEISLTGFGLTTICRMCLSSGVPLFDLFSYVPSFKDLIANTVMSCAPVQISRTDGMPNFICQKCYTRLEKTHQFQMQIVQSEKTLRRYLGQVHDYDKKTNLESSSQRPPEDSLIDNTNTNIIVKSESSEIHDIMSYRGKEEYEILHSLSKINNELISKSKIKVERIDDDSTSPAKCADVKRFCEGAKGSTDIDIEDSKLEEGRFANFNSAYKTNDKMSTTFKIKDEPMDDNSLIPAECASNTIETLFVGGGFELNFEDSKTDIGDIDVNWKESEPANLNTASTTIREMSLKYKIKEEQMDNSLVTADTKIDYDCSSACLCSSDLGKDFENFEEESISTTLKRGKHKQGNKMKPPINETCSPRRKSDTNSHKREHSNKESFESNVCNESFTKVSILNTHKLMRTGKKPNMCEICSKCFNNPAHLKIHKRIHTGEKPFKCDVCNKCFSHLGNLRTHKVTHTGEKSYICDVCKKCFARLDNLKTHKATHTGEKPFKCDVCNKCFSHLSNLKTHQVTHTGEKPYKCDVCKKGFTQLANLKTHKLTHTGEKPYECDVCKKCFSQLANLKTHKVTHADE